MRPLKIKLVNFRAYEGEHTIDLSEVSSAIVIGNNDAGKSSLFIDAMLYALFGKARKRTENLITNGHDNMMVELTFRHNGTLYTVAREQKGDKQSLKLFHGEKNISERLFTANKKKLEDILKIDYDLLLSTAIAEQDDISKLARMLPSEREKILNEMLGNKKWEELKEKVSKHLNKFKDLAEDIKQVQDLVTNNTIKCKELFDNINQDKSSLELLKNLKTKAEIELKSFDDDEKKYNEFVRLQRELTLKNQNKEQLEKTLQGLPTITESEIQEQIKTSKAELSDNAALLTDINTELKQIEKDLTDCDNATKILNHIKSILPQTTILDAVPCKGMDIHQTCKLLQQGLQAKKEVDEYKSRAGDIDKAEEFLIKIRKENLSKKDKFNSSKTDLVKLNLQHESKIKELDQLSTQISKRDGLISLIQKISNDIEELIKQTADKPVELDKTALAEAKAKLNNLDKQCQEYLINIAKSETQLELLTSKLAQDKINLDKYNEDQSKLANYRKLLQAYSDIPTLLFEQAIPTLEQYTNDILAKIFPTERVKIRSFEETKSNTLRKALDVVSLDELDFEDKSGSGRVRQSIAQRIALARYTAEENNIDLPIMVIDEGSLGSLDENNKESMKLFLKEIASKFDLFLLITHIDTMKDCFPTKIMINSTGKGSKVDVMT